MNRVQLDKCEVEVHEALLKLYFDNAREIKRKPPDHAQSIHFGISKSGLAITSLGDHVADGNVIGRYI